MNAVEIIGKKRDKLTLTQSEINYMIDGYTKGEIPDYQMSAFAMAIYFNKMDYQETAYLTQAMLHSGMVLDLKEIPAIKVDKHSTGGVGDKISLPLVGIVAAAGIPVPMISGRGLGHTGGTLDKLEAIEGFNVNLTIEKFVETLKKINCAMIGQTKEIAPADKKLYALRDVTGTVSSIPLITSSIMSKKLAEGADAFALDIKYGHGAFMQKKEDALLLAEYLVKSAVLSGKNTIGYLTNMDQPLGFKIGNWLEVEESLDILQDKGPKDVSVLTHLFAATMIMQGGKAKNLEDGYKISQEMVKSGKAYDKFIEMVKIQGGNVEQLTKRGPSKVKHIVEIKSQASGYLTDINSLELGMTGVMIEAGRKKVTDNVDHQVGIEIFHKIGDQIKTGDVIAKLYVNKAEYIDNACEKILSAYIIGAKKPELKRLVEATITKDGIGAPPEIVQKIEADFLKRK